MDATKNTELVQTNATRAYTDAELEQVLAQKPKGDEAGVSEVGFITTDDFEEDDTAKA